MGLSELSSVRGRGPVRRRQASSDGRRPEISRGWGAFPGTRPGTDTQCAIRLPRRGRRGRAARGSWMTGKNEFEPGGRSKGTAFDGVVCFGGVDWWYHNRGHYDLQMCRQLSARVPVVYVNSLGIRIPKLSEGSMFVRRILRKLGSFRRGFARIDDRFAVMSPISIPGSHGMALSRNILKRQVQGGLRRMDIRNPLVWVTCPSAVDVASEFRRAGLVYERTDRWESFPEADSAQILGFHRRLRELADVTLYCSTLLFDEEAATCRNAVYVDHGVDYEHFSAAGRGDGPEPEDLRGIPRPRVGFIGGIDENTFDPDLFGAVARELQDLHFVLVGDCTLDADWQDLANVHLLGRKPYQEVPAYMAGCDVLIMPWNRSEWIRACNPVKLKEYMAVGRPIVSTSFVELKRYEGYVTVADGAAEFATAIRRALVETGDSEQRRLRVRDHTWAHKAKAVVDALAAQGIGIRSRLAS